MPSINRNIEEIPYYLTKKISEATGEEEDVVNLSRGQAGFRPPVAIYEEARRIIDSDDRTLFKYEKMIGSKELRNSVSQWYGRKFDLDVAASSIVIADGGTAGISLSLQVLTNPGDQIIIPDPAYPYYMLSACYGLENRKVDRVPIKTGPLTRPLLERHVTPATKLVILTSPHNPTGVVYDEDTLRGLMDLACEKDFFIVYDENHFPEVYDGRKHLPLTLFDPKRTHSLVLGSLSRLGIQGQRIGWAVVPENLADKFALAYSTHNLSVNTVAQRLGVFVLNNFDELGFDSFFEEYRSKRDWFIPEINKIPGFNCHMPAGTCYAFPDIHGFVENNREKITDVVSDEMKKRKKPQSDIDFALRHESMLAYFFILYAVGVGGLPGITYGPESDRHMRLSFSVDRSEIEKAVQRLEVLKSI